MSRAKMNGRCMSRAGDDQAVLVKIQLQNDVPDKMTEFF